MSSRVGKAQEDFITYIWTFKQLSSRDVLIYTIVCTYGFTSYNCIETITRYTCTHINKDAWCIVALRLMSRYVYAGYCKIVQTRRAADKFECFVRCYSICYFVFEKLILGYKSLLNYLRRNVGTIHAYVGLRRSLFSFPRVESIQWCACYANVLRESLRRRHRRNFYYVYYNIIPVSFPEIHEKNLIKIIDLIL